MFDAHLTDEEVERLIQSLFFVITSEKHRKKFQQVTCDANTAKFILNHIRVWSKPASQELARLVAEHEKSR